jgi:hypothetical protein
VTPHTRFSTLFAFFALSSAAGSSGLGCSSSSSSLPSTFGSESSAATCSGPLTDLPPPPPAPATRAIVFHVTNRASDARWVQTAGDDECAPFDVVRGGAALATLPTRVCGCSCAPRAPRATYRKLGPGETVDITWDGVAHAPHELCVTGERFGCGAGELTYMATSTPYAATAPHYDISIHVESSAPPGCSDQGDGSWTCGADGVAAGTTCVRGPGKVTALLSLAGDASTPKLDFELR